MSLETTPDATSPRARLRTTLALALACLLGLAHAILLYDFVFEDSFITYRYAEHLARGAGLTYNPGEVVEGFTSFGWTSLLSALLWCGSPIVATSRILSLAFALLLAWVTTRMARRWTGRTDAWTVIPALILIANGTWAYYAMTGMETTLFALLVSVGTLAASIPTRRGSISAALALAAAALVRPEGLGYFAVVVGALVLDAKGRTFAPWIVGIFSAIFVPYFAWRWHHFGYLLPNTYYAKASPSGALFRNGLVQTEAYFTAHLFWLVPLALIVLVRARGWTLGLRLAASIVLAAVVDTIVVGGDGFAFYRFLLPALPAGAVVMVAAVTTLAETPSAGATRRRLLALAPIALAGWTFCAELVPFRTFTGPRAAEHKRVENVERINDDYLVVGPWLGMTFPGKTLAINAAGIIPFLSGLDTIDMLGLNDVHIAHVAVRLGNGTAGHEKHDGRYVLGRKPDLILLGLPTLMKRPLRAGELDAAVGQWFPFLPGDREIYEDPSFRRDYAPRGVEIAPGKFLLIFLRQPASTADRKFGPGSASGGQPY